MCGPVAHGCRIVAHMARVTRRRHAHRRGATEATRDLSKPRLEQDGEAARPSRRVTSRTVHAVVDGEGRGAPQAARVRAGAGEPRAGRGRCRCVPSNGGGGGGGGGGRGQGGLSSEEAEARFKLCGEALEVLGDCHKRALYDQVGAWSLA